RPRSRPPLPSFGPKGTRRPPARLKLSCCQTRALASLAWPETGFGPSLTEGNPVFMGHLTGKRNAVSFALFCSTALLGAGTVPAAADGVPDSSAPLPISSASDIVVDDAHQRVFISSPADNSVLVTDFSGSVVGEIDSEPGAQGLGLSNDFLYVALPDAH